MRVGSPFSSHRYILEQNSSHRHIKFVPWISGYSWARRRGLGGPSGSYSKMIRFQFPSYMRFFASNSTPRHCTFVPPMLPPPGGVPVKWFRSRIPNKRVPRGPSGLHFGRVGALGFPGSWPKARRIIPVEHSSARGGPPPPPSHSPSTRSFT